MVVQAITRLNIGGPGRHVLDIARGLAEEFDIKVVAGTAPATEGELPADDVAVDRIPLVRAIEPARDAVAFRQMRNVLRAQRPRVVHSHMAKAGAVARLAAASLRDRPQTMHTFHGHVLSGYFRSTAEAAFAEVERRLARRTDVLVAVSADVRDALLDLGIGRPSQFEVVPVGVDLSPYLSPPANRGAFRRALGLSAEAPLIGVAARLTPIKDHHVLLEALAHLPDVHLAVLGDGELRAPLESHARAAGVGDRVHFTGWCHDMPAALADLDVAALTSRNEGTPLSLIEASAAGVAVVATDVGGVSDVVVHGRTGLLVPPGDPVAAADALRELLRSPARRRSLGDAGRIHVADRYDLSASLRSLATIYDELVRGCREER